MLDPNQPLDARILAFAEAMKAKFVARELKHPGEDSVTHPNFPWERLDLADILGHTREEIVEWLGAEGGAPRAKEAVDVGNLMFLDWAIEKDRPADPLAFISRDARVWDERRWPAPTGGAR